MTEGTTAEKSALERFLNLFTDVRAGEGPLTLLMAFNVFLLLTSYYLIKPVREALILSSGGAEAKSYLVAAMAVILFFLVGGYAKLVSRYERTRLITVVTGIFIACLVAFWAMGRAGLPYLGYAFFIWVGIFSVMVVAQFWSYANDVYNNDSGKRLFPLVAFGGSFGAFAGAYIADKLLDYFSVMEMLLWAAALLGACIALTNVISRKVWGKAVMEARQRELTAKAEARRTAPVKAERESLGFDLLFRHKYIGFIALLVLFLNLVNTNGEYILGSLAEDYGTTQTEEAVELAVSTSAPLAFKNRQFGDPTVPANQEAYEGSVIGSFYASFFLWVNLLGMALQLFLVGRLIKYGGIKAGLLWLPIIALGTYALIFFLPVIRYARIGKTFENASDYSINKTTLQMLFLPTSREIKYKAKQVVDSFFQRIGDVFSAGIVFLGTAIFTFGPTGFAALNLAFIGVWLVLVILIVREHRAIEAGERPEIRGKPEAERAAVTR
ncbi:MAG TPA: Npt1/Npt2 family nucleotide transporter [Gemmatimonadota bacterium]|nr:Npt1/Npt2 family nucleotide transporter [Gemmatimonadota bacterium]